MKILFLISITAILYIDIETEIPTFQAKRPGQINLIQEDKIKLLQGLWASKNDTIRIVGFRYSDYTYPGTFDYKLEGDSISVFYPEEDTFKAKVLFSDKNAMTFETITGVINFSKLQN